MAKGFVKVPREITEWAFYRDVNTFKLYIHLLLTAEWKGTEKAARGTVRTSYRELSVECGLTMRELRTSIQNLEKCGAIEAQTSNQGTFIKIVDFDKSQKDTTQFRGDEKKPKKADAGKQSYDIEAYEKKKMQVPKYKPRSSD